MRFDLDVERMSRTELVANYFEAVSRFELLSATKDSENARLVKLFDGAPNRKQCAKFCACLMRGGVKQSYAIAAAISERSIDSLEDNDGKIGIVTVTSCNARKALKPYGIEIKNEYGIGYYMPNESIEKLQALIDIQSQSKGQDNE